MKLSPALVSVFAGFLAGAATHAQTFTFNGINTDIPDGDLSGLNNAQTVSGLTGFIANLEVTLSLSGTGFGAVNGDYYVTLEHNGNTAVLLNRVGVRAGSLMGYDDNGFSNVTFNDAGGHDDVHSYRLTATGSHTVPIGSSPSPLTGTWASDARNVSPLTVADTAPRTRTLSVFNGMDGNGTWNLFLVDAQGGGTGRLTDWSMQVTATAVPEPATQAVGVGLLLLGGALWRRRVA